MPDGLVSFGEIVVRLNFIVFKSHFSKKEFICRINICGEKGFPCLRTHVSFSCNSYEVYLWAWEMIEVPMHLVVCFVHDLKSTFIFQLSLQCLLALSKSTYHCLGALHPLLISQEWTQIHPITVVSSLDAIHLKMEAKI